MNKRQRKKRRSRAKRMEIRELQAFSREFASSWQARFIYFQHHRRRWLSRTEWKRCKMGFAAEIAAERALIRRMHETHNYTLAGWILKNEMHKGER
jgi:hypothetical protein